MPRTFMFFPAVFLFWLSGNLGATESAEERAVRADCQIEGEAGGLSGRALDEFIDECVEELLGAELINVIK